MKTDEVTITFIGPGIRIVRKRNEENVNLEMELFDRVTIISDEIAREITSSTLDYDQVAELSDVLNSIKWDIEYERIRAKEAEAAANKQPMETDEISEED